jgi:D-inositol-3-phosphate glycosyltransferase
VRVALISYHTSPVAAPGSGDVGGMNVVVRAIAGQLARLGHRVEVYTRRTDDREVDDASIPGAVVRFLDAGPARLLSKAEQAPFIPEFSARLGAFASGWDVVHAHHWLSGLAALPVARRVGVPLVQSFHSIAAPVGAPLDAGEPPERAERLDAERRLAREADAVLAVSRFEARQVRERLGAGPVRVRVQPPGVDAEVFAPRAGATEAGAGTESDDARLLVAARLEPLKGVDLALDVLAGLHRDPASAGARLRVAGGPTAGYERYLAQLRARAQGLGVGGAVDWLGPCTPAELAREMAVADLVLVPSHSETFGLVALEAQACGTPVVAARAGGLAEAVLDGETGLLLGRDAGEWTRAAAALLRDPERRRELGRRGRRHALALTWAAAAAGCADCYREVIADGAQDGRARQAVEAGPRA